MKKEWENQPIDFVITWVDGSDPKWRALKAQYVSDSINEDDSEARYRDWGNLQYWFRAVEQNTPWVRTIHFVTWGHLPSWLNTDHPKLHIVRHEDFIPQEYLPTFNSHTIELNLHRMEGLAEQFVYFNDDMFVNRPMRPREFFAKGRPCDIFALDCIYFGANSAGAYNANDLAVINNHFDKKQMLKKNFAKWFKFRYGIKCLYRTAVLLPWECFPGFFYQHVSNNFLKSTFSQVWEAEGEILNKTCKCKIRSATNVNQWVMKYWQLASGNFYPRKKKTGRYYHLRDTDISEALASVREGKDALICINDTEGITDFEQKKQKIIKAFEKRYQRKSAFEK